MAYEFTPLADMEDRIEERSVWVKPMQLMTTDRTAQRLVLDEEKIGPDPLRVPHLIFDLDPAVLALISTDKAGLREYLNANGGIRVYRLTGFESLTWASPAMIGLDLEGRRVNRPTVKIGNNQIMRRGCTSMALKAGGSSKKRTGKASLKMTPYFQFREALEFTIRQVEAERLKDKNRLRQLFSPQGDQGAGFGGAFKPARGGREAQTDKGIGPVPGSH